jgi:hypothetical protein
LKLTRILAILLLLRVPSTLHSASIIPVGCMTITRRNNPRIMDFNMVTTMELSKWLTISSPPRSHRPSRRAFSSSRSSNSQNFNHASRMKLPIHASSYCLYLHAYQFFVLPRCTTSHSCLARSNLFMPHVPHVVASPLSLLFLVISLTTRLFCSCLSQLVTSLNHIIL